MPGHRPIPEELTRAGRPTVKPVYRLGWLLVRSIFATYFRWRVHHADRVPATGPVILAANHTSLLDPPLVGSALHREIDYLARDSLFRIPVLGSILAAVNGVPVDREGGGAAGLRAILARLEAGRGIILFPEGTRSRDGRLQPARSGIGLAVIKSTAPVVPVYIDGAFAALSRHMRFPRPHRITVTYGSPITFSELREEARTCSRARLREIYEEVTAAVMAAIAGLGPEPVARGG